jgi:integrase
VTRARSGTANGSTMSRTKYHKHQIPADVQGVVVAGKKLRNVMYVPLRNGMTTARAAAHSEVMIGRARDVGNIHLTEADAWNLASSICYAHDALCKHDVGYYEELRQAIVRRRPDVREWLCRLGQQLSLEDEAKVVQWVERVHCQRQRLNLVAELVALDDPGALRGEPLAQPSPKTMHFKQVESVRLTAGKTPLHSDLTRQFLDLNAHTRHFRRALEQFREICGDRDVANYTVDDCWSFRNWLAVTKDEKKGEALSGQTKNNKLSSVSALFWFAIERRYRNDNPMRNVKYYPKNENPKKRRRLYTEDELARLFVAGKRRKEWQYWLPLLALFAGLRIREAVQLRPLDISNSFGVWHLIIQPGRGQRVKGGQARLVPLHSELLRLGFLDLYQQAMNESRDWLFPDIPLVKKLGRVFNAFDVDWIAVPSTNAPTQWFARYCSWCGVDDPNVDFHALRATFITYGSQQGQDLSFRMEIAGHSKGIHQKYIYDGTPLAKLKEEVDSISYPIRIPRR